MEQLQEINEFTELRIAAGMSRKEFCEYFKLPYRTLQNWELGQRKCNEYILELMEYKLRNEGIIK